MTADTAQREPTMEEILASIRRIISEDDKPLEAGADVLELKPAEPTPVEIRPAAAVVPPPAPPPAPKAATAAPIAPPPAPAPKPTLQEVFAAPELPDAEPDEDIMIIEHDEEPAPVAATPAPAPKPAPRGAHPAFSEQSLVGEPAAA
jgi:cell pole-organizing protein PopZ